MAAFLLVIIYLAFISLGLPDSLLGSAWPAMRPELRVPLASAGAISVIVSGGTIVSSFLSGRLIRRFGTGGVTFASVLMTAVALLGFWALPSFGWLCLAAVPLGLGAGAVDAALNHFVARHYKARHMSWLHCFWGIGATAGPMVLSLFLAERGGWRLGYLTVSLVQFGLAAALFDTLPLWRRAEAGDVQNGSGGHAEGLKEKGLKELLAMRGVPPVLASFFCYCALEATTGLWGSSYLTGGRGLSPELAARWISLFYMGITVGRLVSGFATMRFGNRAMIRMGQALCAVGAAILLLPLPSVFALPGLILIGLGCAPIFPCMLHETPKTFGMEASQALMGVQMAFAYMGTTGVPPLFGLLASRLGVKLFPFFLILFLVLMIVGSEGRYRRFFGTDR